MLTKLLNIFIPPVSPQQFTNEAIALIQMLNTGMKVEVVEPLSLKVTRPDGNDIDLHLTNAYVNYLNHRRQRRAILALFVRTMLDADIDTSSLIPRNIIPTIKDKSYVQEVRASISSKNKNPDEFFVTERYNDELEIVYAVDSPTSIRYLNPSELKEINLQGESLRSFAIGNLKQVLPPVEVHENPPLLRLKAGEMFESSLLLMDRVWNKEELRISGDFIVAIPSRETLLVADGNNEKALTQIRKAAKEIVASAAYRLTDTLFVRRNQSFEVLTP